MTTSSAHASQEGQGLQVHQALAHLPATWPEPETGVALADWENEGGASIAHAVVTPTGDSRQLPELPPRYHAQRAWGFRDASGRFRYELNRVFGPPGARDARGDVCGLDAERTYWAVTWLTVDADWTACARGRSVSMAQARARWDRTLTFEQFTSPVWMKKEAWGLMELEDVVAAESEAVFLGPGVINGTIRSADVQAGVATMPARSA